MPKAVESSSAWQAKSSAAGKAAASSTPYDALPAPKAKGVSSASPFDKLPPPKRPKLAVQGGFQWPTSSPVAAPESTSAQIEAASAKTDSPKTNDGKSAAEKRDEIIETAPRLAEHVRSGNTTKVAKVATMASTLLESGRVTAYNSAAFFEILEAGISDSSRVRNKELRTAMRTLYAGALAKQEVFCPKHQAMLRLWQMRIVNQIDLQSLNDQFARIAKEIRLGLLMLPCISPAMEPPTRSGAPREHMPEHARRVWADALFECLEVAHERYNKREWAQSEVNMLVKSAHDRRQNFTEEQGKKLQGWELERRDTARLDATGFKPATKPT